MDDSQLNGDLTRVLVTEEELATRITELAGDIDRDYAGKELLLVGVLNGAVMVMADLSRALSRIRPVRARYDPQRNSLPGAHSVPRHARHVAPLSAGQ